MYKINYLRKAQKQLKSLVKNQKLLARYFEIEDDILINPYSSKFKFERLRSDKAGMLSKRLTDKDRIVYKVSDDKKEIQIIEIISVLGHYDDK
jgi:toxin YoeB